MKKLLAITGPFVPHNETVTLLTYKHLRELDVKIDVMALKGKEDDTIKKELEKDGKFNKFSIKCLDYNWHDFSIRKDNLNIFKILYNLHKYYIMSFNQVKNEKYEYIYSSSVPNYTHNIANKIKRKNKDIVWIASFSDPIRDNLYAELDFSKARTIKGKIVNFIQRRIHYNKRYEEDTLKNADYLIFLSEEQRDYMIKGNKEFLNKSVVIPLTYIKEWDIYKKLLYQTYENKQYNKDNQVKFMHFGNIYGYRKIDKFLIALDNIRKENTEVFNKILVEQYGYVEQQYIDKIKELNLDNTFIIQDKIKYEECIEKMKNEADCLIIFDTILEDTDTQPWLPSKILEYLLTKKPIFSVCSKSSPIYRMLNEHHICAMYNEKDIKKKMLEQVKNLDNKNFDETEFENKKVIDKFLKNIVL